MAMKKLPIVKKITQNHLKMEVEGGKMRELRSAPMARALKSVLWSTAALSVVSTAAVAQEAGSDGGRSLDVITVTAQKRAENSQDVPIAVSAYTAKGLTSKGITNISQIGEFTPNVTIDNTSSFSGSTQVLSAYIRGIGQSDFAFNLDPGVGIYVDGVYYARSFGAVTDLLDLERVEVLKGPQGTLFGRNTIGGAINIITRRPSDTFQAVADVTTGSFSRLDVRGAVDIPLIKDTLFGQVSFSSKTRGGYHKNVPLQGNFIADGGRFIRPSANFFDESGGENTQNIRAKLEWRASDRLNFTLSGDYMNVDEQATPSVLLAVGPGLVDVYNACISLSVADLTGGPLGSICTTPRAVSGGALAGANVDGDPFNDRLVIDDSLVTGAIDVSNPGGAGYSQAEAYGFSLTTDWDWTDSISLKSITAYRQVDATFAQDVDGTPVALGDHAFDTDQWQASQELQLTGTSFDDRLNWLFGAYLFHEEGGLTDFVHFAGGLLQILGPNDFNTDSYAGFTHLNYALTDNIGLTFGARYTKEDKEFFGGQRDLNSLAFQLGFPLALHPDPTDTTLYFPPVLNQRSFDNLSFKAGIEYSPSDNILTYLSFSQGYKSGGWTTRATVPILAAPEFDEEKANTYEAGFKGEFFDRRLQTNIAAFFTQYKDLQVTIYQGISPVTENAAASEIKGFEFEFQSLPTDNLEILGSVGFTDAEYTELIGETQLQPGFLFQNTPRWSSSLTGIYSVSTSNGGRVSLQGDWTYRSTIANSPRNTPELIADPVHLFSAVIKYDDPNDRYTVSFGGRNLSDERFIVAGQNQDGIGYVGGTYNRPREWYLSLGYRF
jgi:iron complex outermembrane recepter protein